MKLGQLTGKWVLPHSSNPKASDVCTQFVFVAPCKEPDGEWGHKVKKHTVWDGILCQMPVPGWNGERD